MDIDIESSTTGTTTTTATATAAAAPAIYRLPQDALHHIFSTLPLRQIIICRSVCKLFHQTLTSPSFLLVLSSLPPLSLLSLRPPHHPHPHHPQRRHSSHSHPLSLSSLHSFDPSLDQWFSFPLSFLPIPPPYFPITSSNGVVYLWGINNSISSNHNDSSKSLIACNPLTRDFKILPVLGSAWSRHGSVLVDSSNRVMVLTELAALLYSAGETCWRKFSSNLPSKPRSPVLLSDSVFALCDVGSPWRSQWKLFMCSLKNLKGSHNWVRLEKREWGDVFDILKRPRLVKGVGEKQLLMVGGLKSSSSFNATCSTILILKLDLETMDWDKVGSMPGEMFRSFAESSKFKVFGGGNRLCFSAKRTRSLVLWESSEANKDAWRWIQALPGYGDGLYRGFVFEARPTELP